MRNPSTSTHSASWQLGIPRKIVWRILRKCLKLHPYKVQLLHELKPNDILKCSDFAMRILNKINEDNCYLKNVIFSDEATFYVFGYVNCHKCRICGTESPRAVREKARSRTKMNVRCALVTDEIFENFFFRHQADSDQCYTSGHAVVLCLSSI
ncbi:DUF4817 domain-containing protein [Nephila pilipes]|uniref:DUF4817 domain-containing protein n=1 Tax=Nephila pilipes TaxID=299642 RepID=A0A8X6NHF0_NEPPI|nr:DUF4817 domain-containing protein [Nephila pilipes]